MISSEERRLPVGASGTARSTVRPRLPSTTRLASSSNTRSKPPTGDRPTLRSTLRPSAPSSDDPIRFEAHSAQPAYHPAPRPEPMPSPVAIPADWAVAGYDAVQGALACETAGADHVQHEFLPNNGIAASFAEHEPHRDDVRQSKVGSIDGDDAGASEAWRPPSDESRHEYFPEATAPLRASAMRRQSRWLYAVSRQVLFGTPRGVVASACLFAAIGLTIGGGSALMPLPASMTEPSAASNAARPAAPSAVIVSAPAERKTKIALSIPPAIPLAEVVEGAAGPRTNDAPAPAETARPVAAAAPAAVPPVARSARLEDGPGKLPMPPIAQSGVASDQAVTQLVAFKTAPFPYDGLQPSGRPFLDINDKGRRGHRTWYGMTLWQEQTFNDNNVLVHVPAAFDPARPGVIVVFFHGYGATLTRDILNRQQVPAQITESNANAVLLAPQFAVDARDSSAGRFWEPGGFSRFLDEAAKDLARLRGDPSLEQKFAKMPVVIVAYSGGFLPAAWALRDPAGNSRVRGLLLLDAIYGEIDQFAGWAANNRSGFLVSAYTRYTQYLNTELGRRLAVRGIGSKTKLDGDLQRGSAVFLATGPDVHHNDFVTQAWTANPIKDVLSRVPDIAIRDPQTVASIDH